MTPPSFFFCVVLYWLLGSWLFERKKKNSIFISSLFCFHKICFFFLVFVSFSQMHV
ncbi:hypothetical protein BD560DRAFT_403187 [Blakeslea trispora]|nr:hypothetical protein BD560DRAFT_403187 [Blakeslea trispora]